MTGMDYVAAAIELLEDSLAGTSGAPPITSVSAWADRVGYSAHHFARLFAAVTGMPPKEYLQGRRLTVAAKAVTGSGRSLGDIAAEAAYADYETFSRAFKARFGISPKAARERGRIDSPGTERNALRPAALNLCLESMEPEERDEGEHHLTGLAAFMPEGVPSFHEPWARFSRAESLVRGVLEPRRYYQYASWPPADSLGGIAILCALETDAAAEQEAVFASRSLPAARYLRFVHSGPLEQLHRTYRYIYGEYLARSGVVPLDCWEFQRSGKEGDPVEIYLPIGLR